MLVDVANTFQNLMYIVASTNFTVVLSSHNLFKELLANKKVKHEVVKPFFRNTVMKVHDVSKVRIFRRHILVSGDPGQITSWYW